MKKNNISTCICSRGYSRKLLSTLNSASKANNQSINLRITIILNTTFKLKKKEYLKIKKILFKIKFNILYENRKGVSYARNRYLKYIYNKNIDYCNFIDDDCIIKKNYFLTYVNNVNLRKYDILTGPQIYKSKKYFFRVLERKFKKNTNVAWASTNNVFFKKKVLKSKIFFSNKVTKYGFGEDQLFFSKLNKLGKKIIWINNPVYELRQKERENLNWFVNRSYKFGLTGLLIDVELHGYLNGTLLNFSKIFLYFLIAFVSFFLLLLRPNTYLFILLFNLFRLFGRVISLKNIIVKLWK